MLATQRPRDRATCFWSLAFTTLIFVAKFPALILISSLIDGSPRPLLDFILVVSANPITDPVGAIPPSRFPYLAQF